MTAEEVKQSIRNVPDYPIKGIQFKDITTALAKPACLKWMRDELVKRYKDLGITQVVGIESRGFIIAPAVAMEIGAGFVPIRKPGKVIDREADQRIRYQRKPEIEGGNEHILQQFHTTLKHHPPEAQKTQPHQFAADEVRQDVPYLLFAT